MEADTEEKTNILPGELWDQIMADFDAETLDLVKKNNAELQASMSRKLHEVLARFQTGIDERFDIVDNY